jgi:hypothetical protein
MDGNFDDLRAVIYSTDDAMKRFRQLVANSVMVMATVIFDKELKTLRNNRWERYFLMVHVATKSPGRIMWTEEPPL